MTDSATDTAQQNPTSQQAGTPGQQVTVQKIYVKDISFETPNSPQIFFQPAQSQPNVSFQLSNQTSKPANNVYEVVLQVTVTVTVQDKTAFLAEVKQAGLFNIVGFAEEQLHYLLNSYCPNMLFPFVRETISDLVTRGGFPQLLLEPINFDAMYAQQVEAQKAQQAGVVITSEA